MAGSDQGTWTLAHLVRASQHRDMSPVIDRLGTDDLVQLAVDVGPVREQVGALLVLDGPVDAEATSALLARRLASVPR